MKIRLIIFITFIICIAFFILSMSKTVFALPIYKNYIDEQIFTQKVKIGYYSGHADINSEDITDYYFNNIYDKGINFSLYINPLYNVSYLRNIGVGVDFNFGLNKIIANNSLSLAIIYNIPFEVNLPYWRVNLNLFLGGSYGIRYTKVVEYYPYYDTISNFGDTQAIKIGLEVSPEQLIDYGIMFYAEYNMVYGNYYNSIEYNFNKYKQYQSNNFTIGVVYNIDYLIN